MWDRVLPGQVMPAGECPVEGCPGAAMLDEEHADAGAFRPALEALMLDLERLHRNIYTGRLRAPVGAYVKEMADAARNALATRPTAAARLQHLRRHRRSGRRVGLLGRRCTALGAAQHL